MDRLTCTDEEAVISDDNGDYVLYEDAQQTINELTAMVGEFRAVAAKMKRADRLWGDGECEDAHIATIKAKEALYDLAAKAPLQAINAIRAEVAKEYSSIIKNLEDESAGLLAAAESLYQDSISLIDDNS